MWRNKSYEVLPALSVRGEQLRGSLRTVTLAWMFGVVWMSLTSGSNIRVFGLMVGFDDFEFGLLAALPCIATLGQLAAAVLIERTGLRKYQFLTFGTANRGLWLLIALIPLLLPVPTIWAVAMMLAIRMFQEFFNAMATPAWFTWMGDLVPRRIRGRYFADRVKFTRGVQILSVVALGVVLDWAKIPGLPETAASQPLLLRTNCIVLAIAALCGMADILLFLRIRDVRPQGVPSPAVVMDHPRPTGQGMGANLGYGGVYLWESFRQLLIDPLKDRVFRHYVLYGATIMFAMTCPAMYFWRHCQEWLGFSNLGANMLFLVISPIAGVIGSRVWGRLVDRWGRRPVLVLSSAMTTMSVMPYFFTTRHPGWQAPVIASINGMTSWFGGLFGQHGWAWLNNDMSVGAFMLVALSCTIGGMAWTGVNLGQTSVILGFSDGAGRSKYVAASAVLINLGGLAGGLVGGSMAEWLQWMQKTPFGPWEWNNWQMTFALSGATRALSIFWLINMPDPGAGKIRDLMKTTMVSIYNGTQTFLVYPLRVFGRRRKGE